MSKKLERTPSLQLYLIFFIIEIINLELESLGSQSDGLQPRFQGLARCLEMMLFPLDSYEEKNLAWKEKEWRTYTSSERAQMMGFPIQALTIEDELMTDEEAEMERNCFLTVLVVHEYSKP